MSLSDEKLGKVSTDETKIHKTGSSNTRIVLSGRHLFNIADISPLLSLRSMHMNLFLNDVLNVNYS